MKPKVVDIRTRRAPTHQTVTVTLSVEQAEALCTARLDVSNRMQASHCVRAQLKLAQAVREQRTGDAA